jgi:hypothetical protein
LAHREQVKVFFFEKKKQKAFVCAVADLAGEVRVSTNKSFLVLFLEKGLLAFYKSWSRPAGISLNRWVGSGLHPTRPLILNILSSDFRAGRAGARAGTGFNLRHSGSAIGPG